MELQQCRVVMAGGGSEGLRWAGHQQEVWQEVFCTQYCSSAQVCQAVSALQANKATHDIRLATEDGQAVEANRVVLSAGSPVPLF